MSERMHVSFACNDPCNGMFHDECNGVQVEDADGSVIAGWILLDVPMKWEGNIVTLGGESFFVHGRAEWVGNWCWDGTRMDDTEAARLVRWLIHNAAEPDEWDPEHPIGRIVETEVRAA